MPAKLSRLEARRVSRVRATRMDGSSKAPRPPWPEAQRPKRGHGRARRVEPARQAAESSVHAVSNASAATDTTDKAMGLVDAFSRGSKNHHNGQCMPCRSNGSGIPCPRGATCDCCHYSHGPEKFQQMRRFAAMAKQHKRRGGNPAGRVPTAPIVDEAPGPSPKAPAQQEEVAYAPAPLQPMPLAAPPIGLPLCHRAHEEWAQQEFESPRADSTVASTPRPSPYTACGSVTLPPNAGCLPSHISPEQLAAMLQKAAPDFYDD